MLVFESIAWDEYIELQTQDRKTLKKINALIKDISRNPSEGIGKPEPLRGDYSGYWSRRINDKDRIIYYVKGDMIHIVSFLGHYGDK